MWQLSIVLTFLICLINTLNLILKFALKCDENRAGIYLHGAKL